MKKEEAGIVGKCAVSSFHLRDTRRHEHDVKPMRKHEPKRMCVCVCLRVSNTRRVANPGRVLSEF